MRFTILSSALFAAAALAAATPSAPTDTTSFTNAINEAKAHGVDPSGPIPSDAEKLENGQFKAAPFSLSWFWIRAQIEMGFLGIRPRSDDVEKRQFPANVGIGAFSEPGCRGSAFWNPDVLYNVHNPLLEPAQSVAIIRRPLNVGETLNFYTPEGLNLCGTLSPSSVPPMAPPACFPVNHVTCFRLDRR